MGTDHSAVSSTRTAWHFVHVGERASDARPTRLRSIAAQLGRLGIDDDQVVAIGAATRAARAAGLRAGRWTGREPSNTLVDRWIVGSATVNTWAADAPATPDGWRCVAPTCWLPVAPSPWCPGAGAPVVAWVGEPAMESSALQVVEAHARLALLGCPVRSVLHPDMAGLDRAMKLAREMRVADAITTIDDDACLGSVAASVDLAVAAPRVDGAWPLATQCAVPECLAPFAAAGCACVAAAAGEHATSSAPASIDAWVEWVPRTDVDALSLAIRSLLSTPGRLAAARAAAQAAAKRMAHETVTPSMP